MAKKLDLTFEQGQILEAEQMNQIVDAINDGGSLSDLILPVTYEELRDLRDQELLIPGVSYRITDFVTTTSQEGTVSAGHQYDLIVQALEAGKLSEVGIKAAKHEEEPKLLYKRLYKETWDISNDTWTVKDGNIGDEQDFYEYVGEYIVDGDVYYRWRKFEKSCNIGEYYGEGYVDDICKETGADAPKTYILTESDDISCSIDNPYTPIAYMWDDERADAEYTEGDSVAWKFYKQVVEYEANTDYFDGVKLEAWELKYCLDNDKSRFGWAAQKSEEGKGVVYYMKDEHNNECEFDFKNIQKVGTDIREPRAYYFGVTGGSDDSLHGSSHDNHILTENVNGVKYIPTDIYTNRLNVVRYLDGGNPIDNSSEGSSVHTPLEPNKLYDFGEKTEIVITEFLQGKSGVTCEYMFQFTSGNTATSLNVPITVRWMNEPSIQPNKIYQVSIENNLGIIGEWNNE